MNPVRSESVQKKLRRLRSGAAPRVLDLFAGCGGMSLGFQSAGCEILAGIELEPVRAATHAKNFHGKHGQKQEALHGRSRDITALEPLACLQELGLGMFPEVDIVVGGPPCQAYARVGRAKLREIGRHPEAYLHDKRGHLYAAYVAWVSAIKPVAVVMENVPDILSYGGENVAEIIAGELDELGYQVRYTLLNAANYGVPQTRERCYLIGVHRSAGLLPSFPAPTHHVDLPVGYRGTRSHAARWTDSPEARPDHAEPLQMAAASLPPAVGCEAALGDLPIISDAVKLGAKRARRDLESRQPYGSGPSTDYQRRMRNWKGFTSKDGVSAHVIRSLPRDYPIFRAMKEGDEYPAAHAIALAMFERKLEAERVTTGRQIRKGSAAWEVLLAEIVPPYDATKFPNRWRKLERGLPSRTLMAHLSHDSYSHIHYDSVQARTISVREAARLQSFPDGFEFCGAMNAAFGQIGNAVPPLMAAAIGNRLVRQLKDSAESATELRTAV